MAERKSGPVKPPIVELTARPADPSPAPAKPAEADAKAKPATIPASESPKPETQPSASPSAASDTPRPEAAVPPSPSPEPPAPRERRAGLLVPAFSGAVGGAVLGIALSYALAAAGYWPGATTDTARLEALQQRLTTAEGAATANSTALKATDTRLAALQGDVGGKLAATAAAVAALQQGLDKAQAGSNIDLAPLTNDVKTLTARLDAVAAGASSADAGALAANIATLQQNLAALSERASASDTAIGALKAELGAAKAAIDKAAAAPSPEAIAAAVQMPLLLSALDADMAAGKPYAADLQALLAAAPATAIPANISQFAATGLPAPQQFVAAFEARMPDLMAARPTGTDENWQATAGDWLRNVLALRQQGEQAGDTPEAVLSRLEAAVNRRDFAGAATLLAQLPAPMQQALGDTAEQLRALADADAFIAGLRRTALQPAGATP